MRQRGSAAVELALVLPLVLVLALAVVQVGLVGRDVLAVATGAREGAREAAVTTDDDRVRASVISRSGLDEERTEVEVHRGGAAGQPVTVRVRYRAPLAVPFARWLFPDDVELTRQATMRQEVDGG
ncbi:MAG TPA: TadE/TadG family type IV pilus assembly protein [Actinomycetota bacterium]